MFSTATLKSKLILLTAIAVALTASSRAGMACFAQLPGQQEQAAGQSESEAILSQQSALAEEYRLLEEKLFTLYEYERDTNPLRSDLLKRAFLQSQERMTAQQLQEAVTLIGSGNLKDAESFQANALTQMQALLDLLESEDRGKRVRDDIVRHQEYLKEVERILRIQRGIRGRADAGEEDAALEEAQTGTANRTEDLGDEIDADEETESDRSGEVDNSDPESADTLPSIDGEPSENGDQPGESAGEQDETQGQNPGGPSPDSGNQGAPSEGQSGQDSSGQQQNPVLERIRAAEQRMRDAAEDLKQAEIDQSIEDMEAAEAEMAAAKKELEEILRQLREEEIERTLAMLEARFRQMLERELKVYEGTQTLASSGDRGTAFEITAGKLAAEQNEIASEAGKALMLLDEDGSSVAFPETVDQMREDMLQVARRLSAARANQTTLEIEEDIIETLDYIIMALVTTQEDLARMQQSGGQQGGGGSAGDQPLVDQLAEIKMLRGLQDRIYRRHERYSQQLPDPEDPLGTANSAELQRALTRLAERQEQLTEIARDIVAGLNR